MRSRSLPKEKQSRHSHESRNLEQIANGWRSIFHLWSPLEVPAERALAATRRTLAAVGQEQAPWPCSEEQKEGTMHTRHRLQLGLFSHWACCWSGAGYWARRGSRTGRRPTNYSMTSREKTELSPSGGDSGQRGRALWLYIIRRPGWRRRAVSAHPYSCRARLLDCHGQRGLPAARQLASLPRNHQWRDGSS